MIISTKMNFVRPLNGNMSCDLLPFSRNFNNSIGIGILSFVDVNCKLKCCQLNTCRHSDVYILGVHISSVRFLMFKKCVYVRTKSMNSAAHCSVLLLFSLSQTIFESRFENISCGYAQKQPHLDIAVKRIKSKHSMNKQSFAIRLYPKK